MSYVWPLTTVFVYLTVHLTLLPRNGPSPFRVR